MSDPEPMVFSRRNLLGQSAGLLATWVVPASAWSVDGAHASMGPVSPRQAAPVLPLTLHSGAPSQLSTLLAGKVTALQLMFTGCASLCPLQGAVFSSLQRRLTDSPLPSWQLLSVSIDALGDDAKALAAWRQRFQAGPQWQAGVPDQRNIDRLPDFLGSRPPAGKLADRHTAQIYLFDNRGRFAFRMAELASADAVARAMGELSRLG